MNMHHQHAPSRASLARGSRTINWLAAAGILIGAASASPANTIFFNDFTTTADGWYASGEAPPVWDSMAGTLALPQPTNTTHIVSHFTPTTIQPGETLTLSYNITFSNVGAGGSFRVSYGILNSNNVANWVTGNALGTNNALYNGYTGYLIGHFAKLASGSTSNAIRMHQKVPTSTLLAVGTAAADIGSQLQDEGSAGSTYFAVQSDVTYTQVIELARSLDDTLTYRFIMTGPDVPDDHMRTATLTSAQVFTFDTIAFGVPTTPLSDTYRIDNVSVSVVPEPAHIALAGGLLALLGVLAARRQRRR
jgi:hypothetical protein